MPDPRQLSVFVAAKSDPGRDPEKQINEDAMGYAAIGGTLVAVVCDGMGGHAGGQIASRTAVAQILQGLAAASPERPSAERLHEALVQASAAVYRIGGDAPAQQRPGATCVALWLHADSLELAHVGDSRCYRWRNGKLEPLTLDHSVIQAWIQAGRVPKEQAHLHPDAHRITRALGIEPKVDVELRPSEALVVGDRYLLCSDGLTDLVLETDLTAMLGRGVPLPQLADELVALANQRGGHDNITVLLLQIADAGEVGAIASPGGYVLSTPRVAAIATEQFPMRSGPSARTLPIDAVDRTVLMPEQPEAPADRRAPLAARNTQPITLPGTLVAPTLLSRAHRAEAESVQAPRPQRLWLTIGIALLLTGLAILFGLLRHR